jgi:hypothetical protein
VTGRLIRYRKADVLAYLKARTDIKVSHKTYRGKPTHAGAAADTEA